MLCGRSTRARSWVPQGKNERPRACGSRPVALATAAISIDDLVPSTKLLNIFGFMPAASACSVVMPKWVQTVAGVDWWKCGW